MEQIAADRVFRTDVNSYDASIDYEI